MAPARTDQIYTNRDFWEPICVRPLNIRMTLPQTEPQISVSTTKKPSIPKVSKSEPQAKPIMCPICPQCRLQDRVPKNKHSPKNVSGILRVHQNTLHPTQTCPGVLCEYLMSEYLEIPRGPQQSPKRAPEGSKGGQQLNTNLTQTAF